MKTILSLALSLVLPCLACGSATTDAPGGATGSATQASSAEATPLADLSGTWRFVVDRSDVAAELRERCASEGGGDAAKAAACWAPISAQSAKEKIRFTRGPGSATTWTSFETDGTTEHVYVEVPVELTADGPGKVLAKVTGAPRGEMADRFAKSSTNAMQIVVLDPTTIAMNDPRKGRLVYTKE
ncbi:MAG: hypothetical protein JWP97_1239 [Labilithrix sp.]|nr:hypothetical protein [Labilithrix sp.]